MAGGGGGGPLFESTPSWVIGTVVLVMVGISLAIRKTNQFYGSELMLLGFVSLLLAVLQDEIADICVPERFAKKWIPCHDLKSTNETTTHFQSSISNGGRSPFSRGRWHLIVSQDKFPLIYMHEVTGFFSLYYLGKAHIVSIDVLHHLHYLIFILAIVHVVCCTVTLLLGEIKISQWQKWEESIRKQNEEDDGDARVIFTRSLTFIQERFKNVNADKRIYVFSFFKHLAGIVTKADYTAMRTGFILTHCSMNQRFNFHRYMVYAYEEDFRKLVSISWFLWLFVVISLTLNVAGWNIYFWISFAPLILLLVVGTKLEQVITELAIDLSQRHTVVVGHALIQLSDEHFWFGQPRYILVLIHVILFLNSFGFAIFFWTLMKFGFHSCVMGDAIYVYARIFIMVVIQMLCSYSTIPLYAIVTQMGSSYNAEAMKRHDYRPSNRVTDDRIPEEPDTESLIEMADQQGGVDNKFPELQNKQS